LYSNFFLAPVENHLEMANLSLFLETIAKSDEEKFANQQNLKKI